MDSLRALDRELEEIFRYDFTAVYTNLKEIASKIESPKLDLHESWAKITSKSSIYLCNRAMKQLAEIMLRKSTEGERRIRATKEIRKRIKMMTAYVREQEVKEAKESAETTSRKNQSEKETTKKVQKSKKRSSK